MPFPSRFGIDFYSTLLPDLIWAGSLLLLFSSSSLALLAAVHVLFIVSHSKCGFLIRNVRWYLWSTCHGGILSLQCIHLAMWRLCSHVAPKSALSRANCFQSIRPNQLWNQKLMRQCANSLQRCSHPKEALYSRYSQFSSYMRGDSLVFWLCDGNAEQRKAKRMIALNEIGQLAWVQKGWVHSSFLKFKWTERSFRSPFFWSEIWQARIIIFLGKAPAVTSAIAIMMGAYSWVLLLLTISGNIFIPCLLVYELECPTNHFILFRKLMGWWLCFEVAWAS